MKSEEAKIRYLRWLAVADPHIYAIAMAHGANGLGDTDLSGWIDTVVNAAVTVGGALLAKKQSDAAISLQRKQMQSDAAAAEAARQDQLRLALVQINTQRAAAGLAPVDANNQVIPSNQLPVIPQLSQAAGLAASSGLRSQSFFDGVPTWVWFAGAGVVGLLLVRR